MNRKQILPFSRGHACYNSLARWYPETNFFFFDTDTLERHFPTHLIGDAEISLVEHEAFHMLNAGTGTTINMVRFCRESYDVLKVTGGVDNQVKRQELLIREVASSHLFLSADPLVEVQCAFHMDEQCLLLQNLEHWTYVARETVKHKGSTKTPEQVVEAVQASIPNLRAMKKDILKDRHVKEYYEKLYFLSEQTSCPDLPILVCFLALDIPVPLDPEKVAFQAYFLEEPKNRLEIFIDFLGELGSKRSLMSWKYISQFVKDQQAFKEKKASGRLYQEASISWNLLSRWLQQQTGLSTNGFRRSQEMMVLYDPFMIFIVEDGLRQTVSCKNEPFEKKVDNIMADESIYLSTLDKIHCLFENAQIISHPNKEVRQFQYNQFMYFVGIGLIHDGKTILIKNPLVPDAIFQYWLEHWASAYITSCILSDIDVETIQKFGIRFGEGEMREIGRLADEISSIESEPYLEDLYKRSNRKIRDRNILD